MKRDYFFILFLVCVQFVFGQDSNKTLVDTTLIDHHYREDQFYVSITYNLLSKKPEGISQNGFSSGFHLGFIRDMPISKKRNVAIGIGLGLSANSYNQTLLISKDDAGDFVYSTLNDNETAFNKNKFSTYLIEVPLEFRWRTSTATEYNFWRIYTGFKLGYVVINSSKFVGSGSNKDLKFSNIDDFNDFQYGLTFSAGYSNINFHFYYALNTIFNSDAKIDGQEIGMNSVKIGLMFYIL